MEICNTDGVELKMTLIDREVTFAVVVGSVYMGIIDLDKYNINE